MECWSRTLSRVVTFLRWVAGLDSEFRVLMAGALLLGPALLLLAFAARVVSFALGPLVAVTQFLIATYGFLTSGTLILRAAVVCFGSSTESGSYLEPG